MQGLVTRGLALSRMHRDLGVLTRLMRDPERSGLALQIGFRPPNSEGPWTPPNWWRRFLRAESGWV
jgi:hypothetical protein